MIHCVFFTYIINLYVLIIGKLCESIVEMLNLRSAKCFIEDALLYFSIMQYVKVLRAVNCLQIKRLYACCQFKTAYSILLIA